MRRDELIGVTTEKYFADSKLAVDAFNKKYAVHENEQYPQAVDRVCTVVANMEPDEESKVRWSEQWFHEITDGQWHPAGSIMNAAGNPVKNISLYNCTTIAIKSDDMESICKARYQVMKVAAFRQGLGVDFSALRPNGAKVHNSSKKSSGVLNWMEDFNQAAEHVGQRGRIPAMLFSLKSSHPDMYDFIVAKSNLKKIVNANISLQIEDAFMDAVKRDTPWRTRFETVHGDIKETYFESAREPFNKMLDNNLEFAEPGAQFIDTIHKYSNSDYVGYPVISSNACSEKMLEHLGVCALLSINMSKIPVESGNVVVESYLKELMRSTVRFMDNVIELEKYEERTPLEEQRATQDALRRLGIGVTNMQAMFLKLGFDYDSEEAIEYSDWIFRKIMYYGYKASIELGKQRGSFKAFDRKKFEQSPYVKMMMEDGLEFTHMRNVEIISIAPTGTLSLMFREPVLSYGIEPAFGAYYWKRTRISESYQYYFVVPGVVRDILRSHGIELPIESLVTKDDFAGTIGKPVAEIIDANRHLIKIKPALEITPLAKVKLMGVIGKYVDSSISTTYMLPENATRSDVYDVYFEAWERKLKSVAAYRDSSRYGIVELIPFKDRVMQLYREKKSLHKSDLSQSDLDQLGFNPFDATEMISVESSKCNFRRYKFSTNHNGTFYILLRDDMQEIFLMNSGDFSAEDNYIIGKISYDFAGLLKNINYDDFSKQLARSKDNFSRFGRFLSVCMRNGLLKEVRDILERESVAGSLPFFLLNKVLITGEAKVCPNCKGDMFPDQSGCFVCTKCNVSKCG